MGSKNTTTNKTNQTTTAAPPSWAQPTMEQLASQIMSGVGTVQSIPNYTGDFVAQPGALQQAVPGGYLDAAALAQSLVPQAQAALNQASVMPTFDITGAMLQPALQTYASTNPAGMEGAVMAATNPVYRQLTEQLLPSLQSSAMDAGAYGGSRALATLPQMALHDFSTEAGNIAAQLNYQDYGDTANRLLQAYGLSTNRGLGEADILTQRLGLTPDLLDSIMRMGGGAAELQAQAAGYDTMNQQAAIDNALQKYQYSVNQPFMGYDVATQLISQLAGNYGTTTSQGTQTQTQKTGGIAPILGGLLGAGMGIASLPMGGGTSLGGSLVSQLFGKH